MRPLKNKKFKKILISGFIFGIVGLIIIAPFVGLMYENWLDDMQPKQYECWIEIYEQSYEPPFYLNITEQQMEQFPKLKEGITSNQSYLIISTRQEIIKIREFFEENNYTQPDPYIKYLNKYYQIVELNCEEIVEC